MSEINAGTAYVRLRFKGRKQATAELSGIESRLKRFGKIVAGLGGIGAGILSFRTLTNVLKDSVSAASNLEETLNKFNVVFGDSADAMRKWATDTADALGRGRRAVLDTAATFKSFFDGLGFDDAEGERVSKALTELAIDFASFHNLQDDDANRRFVSALSGSTEVLDRFGINLKMAAINAELLEAGIEPKNATEAQKTMARYNLILKATQDAQGDAARTAGSYANQVKRLKANWQNLLSQIGTSLLPALTEIAQSLSVLMVFWHKTGVEAEASVTNMTGNVLTLKDAILAAVDAVAALQIGFKATQAGSNRMIADIAEAIGFNFTDFEKAFVENLRIGADQIDDRVNDMTAALHQAKFETTPFNREAPDPFDLSSMKDNIARSTAALEKMASPGVLERNDTRAWEQAQENRGNRMIRLLAEINAKMEADAERVGVIE